jgi:exonuclease III
MADIYKIATLNINGLALQSRIAMLEDFICKQEIDVLFLREVMQSILYNIRGFAPYTNICTSGRGTAVLTREHMPLTNIVRLPTGRGMAADLQGVWLVNIYAPAGAERRQERGGFFTIDIPYLLRAIQTTIIVRGDFNCVLAITGVIGYFNYSRALNELAQGFDLVDMWATALERGIHTHFTRLGAPRLDRIYVSRNLSGRKCGLRLS